MFRQAVANSFIVYGKRRVGGLLLFFHPLKAGSTHYRFFVIAVAGHRCKGVTRWFLNDEPVSVRGDGLVLSGPYRNNAWLWFGRGTGAQEAPATFLSDTSGKWSAQHVGAGVAKIYAKFQMTDDVVQAGMPNITAEIEGKDDILDPRTDTRGYTRNAALIFYDWLSMPREVGGFGAYDDEIDWDWVSAQANVSDELVDTPAGPERRYEFDSYITTGAAPSEVRDTFVTCCAGSFTYSGGKMLMRPGYYVPPSATLSEHDLAGPITVPALLAGDETANEVTGTYIEADRYQAADVPTRSFPSPDVRQQSFDLPHITSPYRGQRILEIYLRKSQAERRVSWPMNIMGIGIATLDTVQLGTARYGLSNYAFQVTGWGLSQDFSVSLQLEEHNAEMFYFTVGMYRAPGQIADLTPADPIGDSRAAHQILSGTQTVAYPVSSTADTVTIIAFDATIDTGARISFPAASFPGLPAATPFVLFRSLTGNAYALHPQSSQAAIDASGSGDNVIVRYVSTAATDGTYPSDPTPPAGDGGGGYNGRSPTGGAIP